ncbi:MAG: zinc-dependent alcohol dehydrogenase family protein [Candidatus Hydrogenedentes bacterium]|nr:zinc-dependent alcohol dehydrogenase family protein [Candidatus Hydrogenedentota bacterium]
MRVMALYQQSDIHSKPLRSEEWELPEPLDNEILVRVQACGICRTDLHIIEGDLPLVKTPIIPGHQVIGVAVKVGKNCTKIKPGNKVGIAWLRKTCGNCNFCNNGLENLCEGSIYTGYHEHGGYAEFTLVKEAYSYLLPDNIDDIKSAPLLCAGIIGYRAWKKTKLNSGKVLAIYGFGASAHIITQIAKSKGVVVLVVSRAKNHQQLAKELGADWVGESPKDFPLLPHSSIIFAPNGEIVPLALQYLQKGGRLVLAGIYMSDIPPLIYEKHLFYEKEIISVTSNTREDGIELLKEAFEIPVEVHVECAPLSEANELLLKLKEGKINGSGVLVMS